MNETELWLVRRVACGPTVHGKYNWNRNMGSFIQRQAVALPQLHLVALCGSSPGEVREHLPISNRLWSTIC